MKTLQFKAFIPKLGITLADIAIYPSGLIGMHPESLEEELPVGYQLVDDSIFNTNEDKDEFVMSILEGDEWIWLEENQYELQVSIDGGEYEPFKLKV